MVLHCGNLKNMNVDYCICGRVATVGAIYVFKHSVHSDDFCEGCFNRHSRGREKVKPTHIRKKSGKKVYVIRHEGGVIVVKGKNGKVHGTYQRDEMAKFHKRYKSLVAKN